MTLKTCIKILVLVVCMLSAIYFLNQKPGNLMLPAKIDGSFYEYSRGDLPPNLVNRLAEAVEFSYLNGAHRNISEEDLYHAHVLTTSSAPKLEYFEAILMHTQETLDPTTPGHEKRNILISSAGQTSIIPCERGTTMGFTMGIAAVDMCSVYPADIGFKEIVTIYFANVTEVSPRRLRGYEHNIRTINGEKILFGIAHLRIN